MADFNSQLPVQTLDLNGGDFAVTIGDGTDTAGVTASNELQVLDSNSADSLTALQLIDDAVHVDDAAFTVASDKGMVLMGVQTADTVNAGDAGALAIDTSRNLKVSIEADNAGIGGGTQYTEDAVSPADPVGNAMMMTRDDALSTVTEAEGDWSRMRGTAEGALWTQDFNSDAMAADLSTIAGDTTSLDGKDLMLGTDFSDVMGTASLVLATQADNVVNTSDGLQTSTFNYWYDGSAWDRARGDATDGLLVNLGSNNDVIQATHDNFNANANIQVGNTDVAETNPVPVAIVGNVLGTEINDYNTTASVAASGSDNHDYSITASTTFRLHKVLASGSGKMKVEVQVGPVAGLATKAVGFSSTSNPNIELTFDPPIEVDDASTGTIRVIRTNREGSAQDVYSTILGQEIAD